MQKAVGTGFTVILYYELAERLKFTRPTLLLVPWAA
jgi:hypothetical protein